VGSFLSEIEADHSLYGIGTVLFEQEEREVTEEAIRRIFRIKKAVNWQLAPASCVSAKGGPDDQPPGLWDQTAVFPDDWNHCRDPELRATDLGDGRILIRCID
jgi:hypothetical protein